MNKRGQGEQFNWIFVIVAGAVILGFFVMFTFKYIELQEQRQDVVTVRFFGGSVLAASSKLQVGSGGASVDSNEENGLRFGYTTNLGYRCNGNESLILVDDGKAAWYRLDDEIVFMDKEMKINSLDLWILPWNYPFHVTNFIYLADPKTNFYLVSDADSEEFINNLDVSSAFRVEKVDKNNLNLKSNSKVVYFLDQRPYKNEILNTKKNFSDVDFVYIDLSKKEASFFDFESKSWSESVKFYTTEENNEQLLGAIFSNDAENFGCSIDRSLERLKHVASIYSKRAELLGQIDRRPSCMYSEIARSLDSYSRGEINLVDNIASQNLAGAGCIWVF